jgi:site-specific DNA-methyltransferase (adenine-specific)
LTDTANAPRNIIFNGDCIDVMQAFDTGSVDMILTDPPYVTNLLREPQSVPCRASAIT